MLPAVLIPLMAASIIGEKITENRAKRQIVNELETDTLLSSKAVSTFIRESFEITDLIAIEPNVIEAMRSGSKQAEEEKLPSLSIAELEQKFATTKILKTPTTNVVNEYLKKVVAATNASEIFITERDGYNVAYSDRPDQFVEREQEWWQKAKAQGKAISEHKTGSGVNAAAIDFSEAITDPKTGQFIGVVEVAMPVATLNNDIDTFLYGEHKDDYKFQIVDSKNGFLLNDIGADDNSMQDVQLVGGDALLQTAKTLSAIADNSISLEDGQKTIAQQPNFSQVKLQTVEIFDQQSVLAQIKYQKQLFSLSTIPGTSLVSIGVVDYAVINQAGQAILLIYGTTAIILSLIAAGVIVLLARQITLPISNLSATTQEAAAGNLDLQATVEGTLETKVLAANFNNLIAQIQTSLSQQEALTEEQKLEKEKLEMAIFTLIDEVAAATDGDLTVRANLDSMEMSTVADLFNAIIDNLQEIAIEAKESSGQVGSSLKQNQEAIRLLAEQAITEAEETKDTLLFVEQMSESIQTVAGNASQAEKITDDTFNTIVTSTENMDLTVDSILQLRTTVGETAKKMKRLGESSQKISQAVSFIEEIALKTNVLAINASVEAGRAGEYGQGFTIVAEQVGALAEQSAAATKEIASIVATIQAETQEVNQAMESGTSQVVETTRLVETTKESLNLVLIKSQEINQLMGSISQTTISQSDTSQNVTKLMQKLALSSETASQSSAKVAESMGETAQVAAKLESTVGQFKVAE